VKRERRGNETVNRVTGSQDETLRLGIEIGRLIEGGINIALTGELGSGKTVLTKGICRGLDVGDLVTSPTFVIVNEYLGRLPVFHVDLYRTDSQEELASTGLDHYLREDGVCVVEWAEKVKDGFPSPGLDVFIEYVSESERNLTITARGEEAEKLLVKLSERL